MTVLVGEARIGWIGECCASTKNRSVHPSSRAGIKPLLAWCSGVAVPVAGLQRWAAPVLHVCSRVRVGCACVCASGASLSAAQGDWTLHNAWASHEASHVQ